MCGHQIHVAEVAGSRAVRAQAVDPSGPAAGVIAARHHRCVARRIVVRNPVAAPWARLRGVERDLRRNRHLARRGRCTTGEMTSQAP